MQSQRRYLPAAGRDIFLPLYDPLTRLMGGERILRRLLDQASIKPNHRVLDVGCGTGTLAVLIKREHPGVDVVGLDPDPKALARARGKPRARVSRCDSRRDWAMRYRSPTRASTACSRR
jgi:SAM-dependent methyltransferase